MAVEAVAQGEGQEPADGLPSDSGTKPDSKTNSDAGKADASSHRPDDVKDSGWEAEKRGLLADLQKERKTRQSFETEKATWAAERESLSKRMRALAGVEESSPEEQEAEEIRERFYKVFPHLRKLDEKQIERLLGVSDSADQLGATVRKVWEDRAYSALEVIEGEVAKALGGDKLTESQTRKLRAAFVSEAQNNPEFLDRFEKGDKTLFAEFTKAWLDDWFEPARRMVTKQHVDQNRRVPFGRDRSIPVEGEKKIDLNDPKAVEDVLVKGYQDRGGTFGRRRG